MGKSFWGNWISTLYGIEYILLHIRYVAIRTITIRNDILKWNQIYIRYIYQQNTILKTKCDAIKRHGKPFKFYSLWTFYFEPNMTQTTSGKLKSISYSETKHKIMWFLFVFVRVSSVNCVRHREIIVYISIIYGEAGISGYKLNYQVKWICDQTWRKWCDECTTKQKRKEWRDTTVCSMADEFAAKWPCIAVFHVRIHWFIHITQHRLHSYSFRFRRFVKIAIHTK